MDFKVVRINEANQASRQIYDTTRAVSGYANAVQGETLWLSPGQTDQDLGTGVDNGTVSHAIFSIISPGTGWIIHCARATGWTTDDGGSGSPIYREVGGGAVAVGTYHTKDANGGVGRYFAEMKDALDATNMAVH